MTDPEIYTLRSKCECLEKETRKLELAKRRLEGRLISIQQSLNMEQSATKSLVDKRTNDLVNLQKYYLNKFEVATKFLKGRLQWEMNQALLRQKEQLKMNFRSDLFILTNRNNQLATMLSQTQQELQKAQKSSSSSSSSYGQHRSKQKAVGKKTDDENKKRVQLLWKDFGRQTQLLLRELKDRETTIDRLQQCISTMHTHQPASSGTCNSNNTEVHLNVSYCKKVLQPSSGGPVRKKNFRGDRNLKGPYSSVNHFQSKNQGKHNEPSSENKATMKEFDLIHSLDPHHLLPVSQVNRYQPTNYNTISHYHHHLEQFGQYCGGSGLETLPEADSEEESLSGTKEDEFASAGSLPTESPSSQISSVDFPLLNQCKIQEGKSLEEFMIKECEQETHKVSLLQSIIKQLKDELRECKDQNELLEFRLLEIQEVNPSTSIRQASSSSSSSHDGEVKQSHEIQCLPLTEVTEKDYESTNSNGNALESRSSCSSDCSESVSLQESGIFESHGSDDGTPNGGCKPSINRELACLTFQIEELLHRYDDSGSEVNKRDHSPSLENLASPKHRSSPNHLTTEIQMCRQKISEFERRLSLLSDVNYIRSLEEKVNYLLKENKRLEEERAEIEEAENDNRHLCQRLEERMTLLQKKKLVLQNKLGLEKRKIEELRYKLAEMEEREGDLCSKITKLEGLLQNYEQRNFELEETCIDMKCSIQFVLHSVPFFSLCYFWYQMRSLKGAKPSSFFGLLKDSYCTTFSSNDSRYSFQPAAIPWYPNYNSPGSESSLITTCSSSRGNCTDALGGSRKHKLVTLEVAEVEPVLKKLKSLKMMPSQCYSNWDNESNKIINDACDVEIVEAERLRLTNVEVQAEGWEIFIDDIILKQREEWELTERSLRKKIEVLECDIDLCQETFDQERSRMIEMYEGKLGEKESELRESRQCQSEKQELQDKWNCLIQELEHFASYLGRNLSQMSVESGELSHVSFISEIPTTEPEMLDMRRSPGAFIDGGGLMAIASSNSNTDQKRRKTADGHDKKNAKTSEKSELIELLQSSLKEHLFKYESREQQLLSEIDRLLEQIKVNSAKNMETESNIVTHLKEENERLQALFKDHDKVWADVRRLQEENEKLESELSDTLALRRRLEDTQKNESELRERLEEVERSETTLKTQLNQMDRKQQQGQEKIQQLRDEIQFLRSKCCQLQDDIDARVARETKYKNDIQVISNKLRESNLELEEKESQLESNEVALQAQIVKLKSQLQELHQSYTDVECSNGMLKEEVSYLEKTVEEAVSKAVHSESNLAAMSHELKQKDTIIEELQRQLRQLKLTDTTALSPVAPHELSDFNTNDGGLHGVVRAMEEVVSLIQTESEIRLSRCESDEILASHMSLEKTEEGESSAAQGSDSSPKITQVSEEDKMLMRLQETMGRLTLQVTKVEETLNTRQRALMESHVTESRLWKSRCVEKDLLLQALGRRIAHMSITDTQGYFINGVLKEIVKLRDELHSPSNLNKRHHSQCSPLSKSRKAEGDRRPPHDFTCDSLCLFLKSERRRIMDLFESTSLENIEESEHSSSAAASSEYLLDTNSKIDFRVLRRIGEDALLVSWTMPERLEGQETVSSSGYEIAVNGATYLRIPKPNRYKAVLFGLNLDEPLQLTFRCPGEYGLESTITFIS